MAPANSPKSIIDMALGTASTVAFAFPPTGMEVGAAIAVVKFLFDLLYPPPSPGLTEPLAQAPTLADLNNALDELRGKLDKDFFDTFTKMYQAKMFSASDALNDAIRGAGSAPKKGVCMPGPTPVWDNGETDPFWQPVRDNPSIFPDTQNWIIASPQYKYSTAAFYAMVVGIELLYLKTGVAWELNNNLRDYETRKAAYDGAVDTYNTNMVIWNASGQDPATKPAPVTLVDPHVPCWGDPADGSEITDRGNITGFKSRIGRANSWFAIETRNRLQEKDSSNNPTGPISYLEGVLNAHDADVAAKNKKISDRLAYFVGILPASWIIVQSSGGKLAAKQWFDGLAGTMGSDVNLQDFQNLQEALWQDSIAGTIDLAEVQAKDLDQLTADDKTKLRDVISKWRDTLKMYQVALTG